MSTSRERVELDVLAQELREAESPRLSMLAVRFELVDNHRLGIHLNDANVRFA